MEGAPSGYARLDAEYLLRIRPFLNDAESRVYEALVLTCDGWSRPTSSAAIASITKLHLDSVRKAFRSLERLCLIRADWTGSPTSPQAQRRVQIVREYGAALEALCSVGRRSSNETNAADDHAVLDEGRRSDGAPAETDRGEGAPGARPAGEQSAALGGAIQSTSAEAPETLGPPVQSNEPRPMPFSTARGPATQRLWLQRPRAPTTLAPPAQRLWVGQPRDSGSSDPDPSLARSSRSDPDLPPSLPPLPAPAAARAAQAITGEQATEEGGRNRLVPDELVTLCRKLWTTNVTRKAARRYLAPLLRVGTPVATREEVERYLRTCAETSRVRRANFPIAAACMPEEFADWLERSRRVRLVPPARASPARAAPTTSPHTLTLGEIGDRAQFCARLARTEPEPTETSSEPIITPQPQHQERATT